MTEQVSLHRRLLQRFRARAVRDIRVLDSHGRLGQPVGPLWLAVVVFLLTALLGWLTFMLGRTEGTPWILLLIVAAGVFGIAVAVGCALAVSDYRALQEADHARAELLMLQADADLMRGQTRARLHDLRAVTAAMGAALHALQRSGADGSIVGALSNQVSHLGELVVIEPAGSVEPIALSEALLQLSSFAALHGVTLIHDAADDVVVHANREDLVAILRNLVDNARKYAPGSPVLITCEAAGPYVKLGLEDRGPGLAAETAEALFLPGVRRGDGAQGYGMGLAIARTLAERMHGAFWYEPHPAGGSRFVLKLPRALPPGGDSLPEAP